MTAVVSREQARRTCLTAAAGVLMLAVAFVMMVAAAPAHGGARAHGAASHDTGRPSGARLAADGCRQPASRSDSATARACRAGPAAVSAWADAYVPSMTRDSWSASSSGRVVRPPLARAAVS
jgi:hypothetical protein